MSYSGQCLTSEALGGRSANRGACAQACRLPYDLIVDGRRADLGARKYLLSPQDLSTVDLVPQLAGLVHALKIEGRLKTPEYVAATTRAYRKALDTAVPPAREESLALEQVFSRGFTHGFLDGTDHQTLVKGLSPKKRGIFLGEVASVAGARVRVALRAPLKPGDGVVFDYGRPEDDEPGGRVLRVWPGGEFEVRGCPAPKPGWRVWKTDDPAIRRELRATFERTARRVPVDATVETDGVLRIALTDGRHRVTGDAGPVQEARTRPLTAEYLREHLGRLGDTPFELRNLDARIGNVMVPVSRINEARRKLAGELIALRRSTPGWTLRPFVGRSASPARTEGEPRLVALCRSMEQLRAALAEKVAHVECDFEDIRRYREAAVVARAAGVEILLAPPRIHKPGEAGILNFIAGCGADGILARSTAHLSPLARVGDFSLNAANERTAEWLLAKGLARIVPSYDLDWAQLQSFLARVDPGRCEVVVHQHMPMFHDEHCLFAAFLSEGRNATECGRPCDRHRVAIEDRVGARHPVKADVGCRNTVYGGVAQSASPYMRGMLELGVRWFRVELLLQDGAETARLIRGYRDVLDGRTDGHALWRDLRASSFMGVTRGPLGG